MESENPQVLPESVEPAPNPAPPQGVVYYTRYGEARMEHPRVAAIGILNLIFCFPYLILTAIYLIGAANPLADLGLDLRVEMDTRMILSLIGYGSGGLMLLAGGILLLSHRVLGKWFTQVAAVLLFGVVIYQIIFNLTSLQGAVFSPRMIPGLMLPGLLLIYPLVAFFVILRPSAELDLR